MKFSPGALACPNTGVINCEGVITSQYSEIFGIPVAVLGLVLFLLSIYMLPRNNDTMQFLWSIAGLGAVIYSFTTQYLLGEICIWCLSLDAVIIATLLVVNLWKQKANV